MFPSQAVPSIKFKLNLQEPSPPSSPKITQLRSLMFPNSNRVSNPILSQIYETGNQTDFGKFLPKITPLHHLITSNKTKPLSIEQLLDQNLNKYTLSVKAPKSKGEQRFKVQTVSVSPGARSAPKEKQIDSLLDSNDQKIKRLTQELDQEDFFKDLDSVDSKKQMDSLSQNNN